MSALEVSRVTWRKSTRSANGQNCVEVAVVKGGTGPKAGDVVFMVRDSKDPDGPQLQFTPAEWEAFLGGVKDGEFDIPA
ncbi:protein of unknown function [Sinosporangium album]|uniref:DUF397 domain-containing protein n=1 Tax=Sinosporangium album TaxID=504805 RepID=A0A1G7R494_9ACTN|nr:DUF397 domain-containing protein [Sinosporangium album]SDG05592.1 protein of unknown function [Sinosporangium album]